MQRWLSEAAVDDLVRDHRVGSWIDSLAARVGVNRTTIVGHLDRRGIERRTIVPKMTNLSVREATKHAQPSRPHSAGR